MTDLVMVSLLLAFSAAGGLRVPLPRKAEEPQASEPQE